MPYVQYGKGSYFGDWDCFIEVYNENKKVESDAIFIRDSTSVADRGRAEVNVIKARQFKDILKTYPEVNMYVQRMAEEKKKY